LVRRWDLRREYVIYCYSSRKSLAGYPAIGAQKNPFFISKECRRPKLNSVQLEDFEDEDIAI